MATVRLGAIHSVAFMALLRTAWHTCVDDAQPKVMVTADGGSRGRQSFPKLIWRTTRWRRRSAGQRKLTSTVV